MKISKTTKEVGQMPVCRINKETNYVVVDNSLMQSNTLSLKAKGLMGYVLSLPDNWDYTLAGLTRVLPEGRDAILSTLEELCIAGYITTARIRDNKGQYSKLAYTFHELPVSCPQSSLKDVPTSSYPQPDFPYTDNPYTENPEEQNNILNKRTKSDRVIDHKNTYSSRGNICGNTYRGQFGEVESGDILDELAAAVDWSFSRSEMAVIRDTMIVAGIQLNDTQAYDRLKGAYHRLVVRLEDTSQDPVSNPLAYLCSLLRA